MKEPYNTICRSGWSTLDTLISNGLCEAQVLRFCKLHQLGFVTLLVSVNLPEMIKPAMLEEEMATSIPTDTRSKMMLRAEQR